MKGWWRTWEACMEGVGLGNEGRWLAGGDHVPGNHT